MVLAYVRVLIIELFKMVQLFFRVEIDRSIGQSVTIDCQVEGLAGGSLVMTTTVARHDHLLMLAIALRLAGGDRAENPSTSNLKLSWISLAPTHQ